MDNGGTGLKLLGKVNRRDLKGSWMKKLNPNREWFFVDYAGESFKINTEFDTLFQGNTKQLIREFARITLVMAVDEMENEIDEIVKGYKMIGLFEFYPQIPDVINELPTLNTWEPTDNSVTIVNHHNVHFITPTETYQHGIDVISEVYFIFRHKLSIGKSAFADLLKSRLNDSRVNTNRIIYELEAKGIIREQGDNLILAEREGDYQSH